ARILLIADGWRREEDDYYGEGDGELAHGRIIDRRHALPSAIEQPVDTARRKCRVRGVAAGNGHRAFLDDRSSDRSAADRIRLRRAEHAVLPLETLVALAETVPTIRAIKDWSNDPMLHERQIRTLQSLPQPVNVLTTHSAWLMASLTMGCN